MQNINDNPSINILHLNQDGNLRAPNMPISPVIGKAPIYNSVNNDFRPRFQSNNRGLLPNPNLHNENKFPQRFPNNRFLSQNPIQLPNTTFNRHMIPNSVTTVQGNMNPESTIDNNIRMSHNNIRMNMDTRITLGPRMSSGPLMPSTRMLSVPNIASDPRNVPNQIQENPRMQKEVETKNAQKNPVTDPRLHHRIQPDPRLKIKSESSEKQKLNNDPRRDPRVNESSSQDDMTSSIGNTIVKPSSQDTIDKVFTDLQIDQTASADHRLFIEHSDLATPKIRSEISDGNSSENMVPVIDASYNSEGLRVPYVMKSYNFTKPAPITKMQANSNKHDPRIRRQILSEKPNSKIKQRILNKDSSNTINIPLTGSYDIAISTSDDQDDKPNSASNPICMVLPAALSKPPEDYNYIKRSSEESESVSILYNPF